MCSSEKNQPLDAKDLGNSKLVFNLPLMGKTLDCAVPALLRGLLDGTEYLHSFQSGFRTELGTITKLVNDHRRDLDRGSASLLILIHLSAAFDTIDHGTVAPPFGL